MEIPRKDTRKIIDLCLLNVEQFLSEVKTIRLENQRCDHSVAYLQFGVEELGKVCFLRDTLLKSGDDPISVPNWRFGKDKNSHHGKDKEAWNILSQELKKLVEGSQAPASALPPNNNVLVTLHHLFPSFPPVFCQGFTI